MPYTGYYSDQALRDKLGNTIGANYSPELIDKARRYGDAFVDSETHKPLIYGDGQDPNIVHGWAPTNPYFSRAMGISMKIACAFVRSTQINVSIQEMREWNEGVQDVTLFYKTLVTEGLVEAGGRILVNQFASNVLNPITGTTVTGLGGIVRRTGLVGFDSFIC